MTNGNATRFGSDEFIKLSKKLVKNYYDEMFRDFDRPDVTNLPNDIYVVWECFILGNQKCLISTDVNDGMYFEVTYNKESNKVFVDAYKKKMNSEYLLGDGISGSGNDSTWAYLPLGRNNYD